MNFLPSADCSRRTRWLQPSAWLRLCALGGGAAWISSGCLTPNFKFEPGDLDGGSDSPSIGGQDGSFDATCNDGVQNGAESDVDCGGGSCPLCVEGDSCRRESDCESGVCTSGRCAAPSCTDGVKNGAEKDVDCGPGCSGCRLGQSCQKQADCLQNSGQSAVVCEQKTCTKTVDLVARASQEVSTETTRFSEFTLDKDAAEKGHRLLAVAVAALNQDTPVPLAVRYGGKLLRLLESEDAGFDSFISIHNNLFAGIYVLGECEIDAVSSQKVLVEMPVQDWAGAAITAALFENVNQDLEDFGRSVSVLNTQSVALATGDTVPVNFWFFGVAANQNNDLTVLSPPSPSQHQTTAFSSVVNLRAITSVFGPLGGNTKFEWRSDYADKVAAGLVLRPAREPSPTCD